MSTPFISILAPPGDALSRYDHSQSWSAQSGDIPPIFLDAMSVREEVFVHEQKCPLEYEMDSDDARSFHWVAYASVGTSSTATAPNDDPLARRKSTATRLAVSTIRLVPPPHPSHSAPGLDVEQPGPSSGNPDNEPFVKLGRFATLADFRKLGLGQLLINSVVEWSAAHADEILAPPSATDIEAARVDGNGHLSGIDRWNGLILIHAQSSIQKYWAKFGFVLDESMGEWREEGIKHVGMWKRVSVKESGR